MENEIIQRLREEVKKEKLPDFELLSKEEIIKYIEGRFQVKDRLTQLINYIYLAIQQSYFDNRDFESDYNDFNILEGRVRYNYKTDQYVFYPNEAIKKLLNSADRDDSTKLKSLLSTKLYKIVEYLYNTEIRNCQKALKQKEKIPPKVLALAIEEEKEKLISDYNSKLKAIETKYLEKLDKKEKEYKDLESIVDILQIELDKFKNNINKN